jgi:endonuclease/exonuclease/phosphatase family metal-dependent hydrolase
MSPTFKAATLNLLNDRSRWAERRALIVKEVSSLAIDLIGLQEVTDPLGFSSAHELAGELGGYSVHVSPKTGMSRRSEGIAILSRLPVERHETLDLGSQERTAQRVEVRVGGRSITFVNGHYYWPPAVQSARIGQLERLLDWLATLAPETAVVACGDFNSKPESRAIAVMRNRFESAHVARHGQEPAYTFPSPFVGKTSLREAVKQSILRNISGPRRASWRATLDYIFIDPAIKVLDCGLFLDRPAPDDPTLYGSDHFGLAATLEVVADAPS